MPYLIWNENKKILKTNIFLTKKGLIVLNIYWYTDENNFVLK